MTNLKQYLLQEIPFINTCIDKEIDKLDPLVQPLASHVLGAGGKRLRPLLCILFYRMLTGGEEDVYPLSASLEFLHSATLIHDDILDGASTRRGKVAAHKLFGETEAILTGDVLLALANKLVASYSIPELMVSVSEAIMHTATGEIQEVSKLGQSDFSLDEYFSIITGKTAWLIKASCQCGAILGRGDQEQITSATDFGLNLGIAFQLVDDALDYVSDQEVTGKPVGGDLREGKFTYPLILYLQKKDTRKEFIDKIRQNRLSTDEEQLILAEMERMGCSEVTREEAAQYLAKAEQALTVFEPCHEKALLLETLEYVKQRDK